MCETRWYLRRGRTRRARNEPDERTSPLATSLRASERLSPPECTCAGHTSTSRSRRLIDLRGLAAAQKVAVRRNAINSAKISKNYAVRGSAFNFAKARKDLSRFGNWHASWIRVEFIKELEKRGNGVAIESTGGLINTNVIVMGIVKKNARIHEILVNSENKSW